MIERGKVSEEQSGKYQITSIMRMETEDAATERGGFLRHM